MKPTLLGVAVVFLFALQTTAQAPRTISHQGRLTDNAGVPLIDSTWTIQFDIYNASGGAASSMWSQTLGVPTVGGIYNVNLGPISGVDFNQPLWLGITVHPAGGESEMTPRTPLTSVPASFALVLPYNAKINTSAPVISVENTGSGLGFYSADSVLIETLDLMPSGAPLDNDDLIIEAGDAVVGLYSNSNGVFGSGIVLGEIAGFGTLTDKWAMARQTSGAASRLLFTFGPSADYKANPMKVWFDTLGQVYGSAYKYSAPKTGYVRVPSYAFHPLHLSSETVWHNSITRASYTSHGPNEGQAAAGVQLPQGATVTNFMCKLYDTSATYDLNCNLIRSQGSIVDTLASVKSIGSGGSNTYATSTIADAVISNVGYGYHVAVSNAANWETAGIALAVEAFRVTYTVSEVP
ncbi:MAG: hypothetical protein ACC655_07425 [Rhodothermia bacterium]